MKKSVKDWKVVLGTQPRRKGSKTLSKLALKAFDRLLAELKGGPIASSWPNYSPLGKMTYHCHLKKGRPTYVACWAADKQRKIIEVYYVGTHEKAPY